MSCPYFSMLTVPCSTVIAIEGIDSVFNGNYLYKAELTNIQDNGAKVDGFVLTFYDADLDRFDPDYNYVGNREL